MSRRILLLITDLQIGGTPTVVRELAIRLRDAGDEVEVASLKEAGPNGVVLTAAGIPVTAFHAGSVLSLPSVVKRLRRLIKTRNVDIVLSFLVHANVVAALAVPRGVDLFQSIQTTQARPGWHWKAQRWAARRALKIIVPSRSVTDAGIARSSIRPEQFVVIPNAIDATAFKRSVIPSASPAEYPVGFIGRLDPVKRVKDLVEAVGLMGPKVRLHVFGDGPERARIERQIARTGTHTVELHGAIQQPHEALAKLGLLILPSESEGFGLVLIEAMAAGVPVVATNAPGIRDVVQHEHNGLLVPVGQPKAIAAAVERVINDAALRARLVENGLATVRECYTWDVVLPQYRRLLGL